MAVKARDQMTLYDVTDGYTIDVNPSSISLVGSSTSKLGTQRTITVKITALQGSDLQIPTVTASDISCPTNVTASVGTLSNYELPITFTFSANLTAGGVIIIPVVVNGVTFNKQVSFGFSLKGSTGTAGTVRILRISDVAVIKAEDGTYTPSSITLSAFSVSGTANPVEYSGYFKIETTTNYSTWTKVYPSGSTATQESIKTYSVPANIAALRCSLYADSSMETLLDQQTVPVVSDGATGIQGPQGSPGADAYTVILDNESHTFPAGVSAAVASSVDVGILALKGGTQMAATIGTITGTISGKITATKSGSGTTSAKVTVSVTPSLTDHNGVLTIPVTVDGKTFIKKFSWSLGLTGETGEQGPQGNPGADAITLKITSSEGTVFKNTSIATIMTAHVYKGGTEITGSTLTALGTIKWYKDGNSTAVGTGSTLNISAGDVTDKAIYEARLEA